MLSKATNHRLLPFALLLTAGTLLHAEPGATAAAVDHAQRQITSYLSQLSDLHCTEVVTQQKLDGKDHVEATDRAKFDYLIMINGDSDDFQLNESRVAAKDNRESKSQLPMLVTNGISTILLVFHPYYRDNFNFDAGAEEVMNGQLAIPIRFSHIPGRRSPAALALRGRLYPLELQGTAWLDPRTGNVMKVDANLMNDMSDVGLKSLNMHVEYKNVVVPGSQAPTALPAMAVVDLSTPRQHWRNTHAFTDYKSFSTDAVQDTNVKVHPDNPDPATDPSADNKENSGKL